MHTTAFHFKQKCRTTKGLTTEERETLIKAWNKANARRWARHSGGPLVAAKHAFEEALLTLRHRQEKAATSQRPATTTATSTTDDLIATD